jgi:REP element-mobilizing transposase RayT
MGTPNQSASPAVGVSLPAWLENAAQSALILGRLVQDPSIQAALILRGKDLWAQAGELLELPAVEHLGVEPAAAELARKVFQYWATDGGSDLTRYVRLASVPGEYILYATGLTGEMVLAILYNEETPFSQMRAQAARLAHTLLSSPLQDEKGSWIQEYPEDVRDENPVLDAALAAMPPLFDEVPPPTVSTSSASGEALMAPVLPPASQTAPGFADAAPASTIETPAISPAAPAEALLTPQPVIPLGTPPAQTLPMPALDHTETISSPLPDRLAMQDVGSISRPADFTPGEPAAAAPWTPPASPALSDLYLAVVLLPRMPKHHLIGDLAALLPQWVAQICMAYGWRLEALRVRPDYVEWVVNIPPSTSASQHLRLMRRQTSQYIMAEFPTFARENPSGEFWAPGYLVTSSAQLPAEAAVQAFMSQIRRQQGVAKPFPDQA